MRKTTVFLYERIRRSGLPLFRKVQVENDLAQLHPGEKLEGVRAEYYGKKLALFLAVILAGSFLGGAVKLTAYRNASLDGERIIYRGSRESGERQLWLEADNGSGKRSFQIAVQPRELTEEEAVELSDSFLNGLERYILNGNEDLQHITADLNLKEEYGGFPFEVIWESSRQDIIDNEGRVAAVEAPVVLELKIRLICGGWERTETISVTAAPVALTEEERAYAELEEFLLKTERESRDEEVLLLPEEWEGQKIVWSLRTEDYSAYIWGATPAVAVLLNLFKDKDLHGEVEKRRKSLRREYPELVYKLLLYMGAGMNIQGAFRKIAADYEKKKRQSGRIKQSFEEVQYTCRELQGGVSEGGAYEHFGKRAGSREYIRLGTLLGQNLKRGNTTLLERLREEAEKASGESLQQVRKLGEEAGTKLLFPMVMMLAVVMIMIMLPAFGTI
ncbi:MAG: hypothetical protein NC541_12585 [bacterium]|nr:hypothetical protein [bacterium]